MPNVLNPKYNNVVSHNQIFNVNSLRPSTLHTLRSLHSIRPDSEFDIAQKIKAVKQAAVERTTMYSLLDPIFNKAAREELAKGKWYEGIPLVTTLAGYVDIAKRMWNLTEPEQALITTLRFFGDTLDTVSILVKAPLLAWATGEDVGETYSKAFGFGDSGRWDTSFNAINKQVDWIPDGWLMDLAGEILIDPLNWASFGIPAAAKKVAGLSDDVGRTVLKAIEEGAGSTSDVLARQLAKEIGTSEDVLRIVIDYVRENGDNVLTVLKPKNIGGMVKRFNASAFRANQDDFVKQIAELVRANKLSPEYLTRSKEIYESTLATLSKHRVTRALYCIDEFQNKMARTLGKTTVPGFVVSAIKKGIKISRVGKASLEELADIAAKYSASGSIDVSDISLEDIQSEIATTVLKIQDGIKNGENIGELHDRLLNLMHLSDAKKYYNAHKILDDTREHLLNMVNVLRKKGVSEDDPTLVKLLDDLETLRIRSAQPQEIYQKIANLNLSDPDIKNEIHSIDEVPAARQKISEYNDMLSDADKADKTAHDTAINKMRTILGKDFADKADDAVIREMNKLTRTLEAQLKRALDVSDLLTLLNESELEAKHIIDLLGFKHNYNARQLFRSMTASYSDQIKKAVTASQKKIIELSKNFKNVSKDLVDRVTKFMVGTPNEDLLDSRVIDEFIRQYLLSPNKTINELLESAEYGAMFREYREALQKIRRYEDVIKEKLYDDAISQLHYTQLAMFKKDYAVLPTAFKSDVLSYINDAMKALSVGASPEYIDKLARARRELGEAIKKANEDIAKINADAALSEAAKESAINNANRPLQLAQKRLADLSPDAIAKEHLAFLRDVENLLGFVGDDGAAGREQAVTAVLFKSLKHTTKELTNIKPDALYDFNMNVLSKNRILLDNFNALAKTLGFDGEKIAHIRGLYSDLMAEFNASDKFTTSLVGLLEKPIYKDLNDFLKGTSPMSEFLSKTLSEAHPYFDKFEYQIVLADLLLNGRGNIAYWKEIIETQYLIDILQKQNMEIIVKVGNKTKLMNYFEWIRINRADPNVSKKALLLYDAHERLIELNSMLKSIDYKNPATLEYDGAGDPLVFRKRIEDFFAKHKKSFNVVDELLDMRSTQMQIAIHELRQYGYEQTIIGKNVPNKFDKVMKHMARLMQNHSIAVPKQDMKRFVMQFVNIYLDRAEVTFQKMYVDINKNITDLVEKLAFKTRDTIDEDVFSILKRLFNEESVEDDVWLEAQREWQKKDPEFYKILEKRDEAAAWEYYKKHANNDELRVTALNVKRTTIYKMLQNRYTELAEKSAASDNIPFLKSMMYQTEIEPLYQFFKDVNIINMFQAHSMEPVLNILEKDILDVLMRFGNYRKILKKDRAEIITYLAKALRQNESTFVFMADEDLLTRYAQEKMLDVIRVFSDASPKIREQLQSMLVRTDGFIPTDVKDNLFSRMLQPENKVFDDSFLGSFDIETTPRPVVRRFRKTEGVKYNDIDLRTARKIIVDTETQGDNTFQMTLKIRNADGSTTRHTFYIDLPDGEKLDDTLTAPYGGITRKFYEAQTNRINLEHMSKEMIFQKLQEAGIIIDDDTVFIAHNAEFDMNSLEKLIGLPAHLNPIVLDSLPFVRIMLGEAQDSLGYHYNMEALVEQILGKPWIESTMASLNKELGIDMAGLLEGGVRPHNAIYDVEALDHLLFDENRFDDFLKKHSIVNSEDLNNYGFVYNTPETKQVLSAVDKQIDNVLDSDFSKNLDKFEADVNLNSIEEFYKKQIEDVFDALQEIKKTAKDLLDPKNTSSSPLQDFEKAVAKFQELFNKLDDDLTRQIRKDPDLFGLVQIEPEKVSLNKIPIIKKGEVYYTRKGINQKVTITGYDYKADVHYDDSQYLHMSRKVSVNKDSIYAASQETLDELFNINVSISDMLRKITDREQRILSAFYGDAMGYVVPAPLFNRVFLLSSYASNTPLHNIRLMLRGKKTGVGDIDAHVTQALNLAFRRRLALVDPKLISSIDLDNTEELFAKYAEIFPDDSFVKLSQFMEALDESYELQHEIFQIMSVNIKPNDPNSAMAYSKVFEFMSHVDRDFQKLAEDFGSTVGNPAKFEEFKTACIAMFTKDLYESKLAKSIKTYSVLEALKNGGGDITNIYFSHLMKIMERMHDPNMKDMYRWSRLLINPDTDASNKIYTEFKELILDTLAETEQVRGSKFISYGEDAARSANYGTDIFDSAMFADFKEVLREALDNMRKPLADIKINKRLGEMHPINVGRINAHLKNKQQLLRDFLDGKINYENLPADLKEVVKFGDAAPVMRLTNQHQLSSLGSSKVVRYTEDTAEKMKETKVINQLLSDISQVKDEIIPWAAASKVQKKFYNLIERVFKHSGNAEVYVTRNIRRTLQRDIKAELLDELLLNHSDVAYIKELQRLLYGNSFIASEQSIYQIMSHPYTTYLKLIADDTAVDAPSLEEFMNRIKAAIYDYLDEIRPDGYREAISEILEKGTKYADVKHSTLRSLGYISKYFGDSYLRLREAFGDDTEAFIKFLNSKAGEGYSVCFMVKDAKTGSGLRLVQTKNADELRRIDDILRNNRPAEGEAGMIPVGLLNPNEIQTIKKMTQQYFKFDAGSVPDWIRKRILMPMKSTMLLNLNFVMGNVTDITLKNLVAQQGGIMDPDSVLGDIVTSTKWIDLWHKYDELASQVLFYGNYGGSYQHVWVDAYKKYLLTESARTGQQIAQDVLDDLEIVKFVNQFQNTPAAASEMVDMLNRVSGGIIGKNNDEFLDKVINKIFYGGKYSPFRYNLELNGRMELTGRLALHINNIKKGFTQNESLVRVLKTHFNYSGKTKAELWGEFFIPFISYPVRSFIFWSEAFFDSARNTRLLSELLLTAWGREDLSKSDYAKYQASRGNLPIGNNLSLSTGLTFADAMTLPYIGKYNSEKQTMNNQIFRKLNPYIKNLAFTQGLETKERLLRLPGVSQLRNIYTAATAEEKNANTVLSGLTDPYFQYQRRTMRSSWAYRNVDLSIPTKQFSMYKGRIRFKGSITANQMETLRYRWLDIQHLYRR